TFLTARARRAGKERRFGRPLLARRAQDEPSPLSSWAGALRPRKNAELSVGWFERAADGVCGNGGDGSSCTARRRADELQLTENAAIQLGFELLEGTRDRRPVHDAVVVDDADVDAAVRGDHAVIERVDRGNRMERLGA